MNTNKHESENDSFRFQLGMFEIQDEADAKLSDSQVIQHLATLNISDSFDCFRIHYNCVKRDEVWDETPTLWPL